MLIDDPRLRDMLAALRRRDAAAVGAGRRFRTPRDPGEPPPFPRPSVIEQAIYAVDCSAAGEIEVPAIRAAIAQLEARIAPVELGFWSKARWKLRHLGAWSRSL